MSRAKTGYVYFDVQDHNSTCKFHEEGPMESNITVFYFLTNKFLYRQVEDSRVVRWCRVRKVKCPKALIL